MGRFIRLSLAVLFVLSLALTGFHTAQAARGAPGTFEFGMGAVLYPQGPYLKEALTMAAEIGLDWIRVPVAWEVYQPDATAQPHMYALDTIMQFAAEKQIAVLVSISNAPAWARTSRGPDPVRTAQFVLALVKRYPKAIQAVELFPGANTRAGWGGSPDPQAYYALFQQVNDQASRLSPPLILAAAGLQPLGANPPPGDVDDLAFLQALYRQGAARTMPVISLHYGELTGDPLTYPDGSEHRVLRHYEEVRRIMSENQHRNGLIWITHLTIPSCIIGVPDSEKQVLNTQSSWMAQAYVQTRSHLYIGLAIVQSLNPESEGAAQGVSSLLLGAGVYHPFYTLLREMVSLNKSGEGMILPGRPKEGNFAKKRP